MKRLLLILAVTISLLYLQGCGGSSGDSENGGTKINEETSSGEVVEAVKFNNRAIKAPSIPINVPTSELEYVVN